MSALWSRRVEDAGGNREVPTLGICAVRADMRGAHSVAILTEAA